jgi:hypothetical protein
MGTKRLRLKAFVRIQINCSEKQTTFITKKMLQAPYEDAKPAFRKYRDDEINARGLGMLLKDNRSCVVVDLKEN